MLGANRKSFEIETAGADLSMVTENVVKSSVATVGILEILVLMHRLLSR